MNTNKEVTIKKTFELAIENHQANKIKAAENLYNQVLKIDPKYVNAHINLGILFQNTGDFEKAIIAYDKVIEIDPNNANVYNNLGKIFRTLADYPKAKSLYLKAIEIDSNHLNALYNIGVVLTLTKNYNEAKVHLEKVIKIDPNHTDAYNYLGLAFKELGENQKALRCFEKIIEINPSVKNGYRHLADMHEILGNHIESVKYLQEDLINRSEINFDTVKEENQKLRPAITSFFLELTNKCNFHCEFCPSDSQTRLHGFMELSLVKKVFDEISKKKIIPRVNLHLMGEPTLHPKLNEILDYAKSKNVKIDLTTNGSTMVEKRVPSLLNSISGLIMASLMTPTEETYKIRGEVGLSWDRYVGNFRLLIREHLKKILRGDKIDYEIVFRVMVTDKDQKGTTKVLESSIGLQENYDEWSNFTENVEKELGLKPFDRHKIDSEKIFSKLGDDGTREVSFYLQRNVKIQFWRAFTFANTRVNDDYILEPQKDAVFCSHPFKDFGVLWNGDVSLCCLDYDATLKVGNVNNHSIEDVMNSEASKKLRASMYGLEKLHPTCVKCQSLAVEK